MLKAGFLHRQNNGVGYNRFWLPARWLREHKLAETRRLPDQPPAMPLEGDGSLCGLTAWADVLCVDGIPGDRRAIAAARAACDMAGIPLVAVVDDLYTNVPPGNIAHDGYLEMAARERYDIEEAPEGLTNDQMPEGVYLVEQEGKHYLWREKRTNHRYLCIELMEVADALVCTTPALQEAYGEYNPHRYVCPNCLDWDAWDDEFPAPRHERLRILWAGSAHHTEDLAVVVPALEQVLGRHADVELVIAFPAKLPHGLEPLRAFGERFRHVMLGRVNCRSFPGALVAFRPDICMAPLWPHPFNDGKSCLKWLEASGANAAFVGSRTRAYADWVEDGVDGYLATSTGEWVAALENLINHPRLRRQMVGAARTVGREKYGAAACARSWYKALAQIAARGPVREAVTA